MLFLLIISETTTIILIFFCFSSRRGHTSFSRDWSSDVCSPDLAGMLYQAGLRAELTRRLGLAWGPVTEHGQAELAGMPRQLLARFSTRAAEVEAAAEAKVADLEGALGRPLEADER